MTKPTPQFWKFAGSFALTVLYMLWASYMLERVSNPSRRLTFAQYAKESTARVWRFWNPPTLTDRVLTRSSHYFGGNGTDEHGVYATCRECGYTAHAKDVGTLMGYCLAHMAFPMLTADEREAA